MELSDRGLRRAFNALDCGEFQRKIAQMRALTSVRAPLICPASLRPEPFSGRFSVFAESAMAAGPADSAGARRQNYG
jgi:hypothetical protein